MWSEGIGLRQCNWLWGRVAVDYIEQGKWGKRLKKVQKGRGKRETISPLVRILLFVHNLSALIRK